MSRIFLSPPDVTGMDRKLLMDAVDSNWVAPVGPDLNAFEAEIASSCGRRFGVGLASGTAALHLALLELGVRPGDEVIVPSFTFVATANAVKYCGAIPILVDADVETWQVSPALVGEAIIQRRRAGARIAAAIVVDLYGQCADYDQLLPIFREASIPVIEDAAEALGAGYRCQPAGSFGDAAIVSFNGNKIITTSGGGMLVTDDNRIAERCRHLATQAREPVPYYEHTEVGFNYRLSNLLAAFGRGQLSDLKRRVDRRRCLFARYQRALAVFPHVHFMPEANYGSSTRWLTCFTIARSSGVANEHVRLCLESHDIESRHTWKPMHLQPAFSGAPAVVDGTSERLFREGLCLPSGSSLTDAEQERVIDILLKALIP